MKLEGHPFPQNMVGFSVNMVTAEEKGKVKVLTSARAKQDGSVDPTRQVTVEQVHKEAHRILKSQIEVGESSRTKPRVTTRAFSLTSGNVNRKRNATKSKNTKRRSGGLKKKCVEESWKSIHGNKSVHIGDAHSSGIAGMRA
jgi:hypothetical protein